MCYKTCNSRTMIFLSKHFNNNLNVLLCSRFNFKNYSLLGKLLGCYLFLIVGISCLETSSFQLKASIAETFHIIVRCKLQFLRTHETFMGCSSKTESRCIPWQMNLKRLAISFRSVTSRLLVLNPPGLLQQ